MFLMEENEEKFSNVEAEMTILGILLLEPERMDEIEIDAEDFFVRSHKIIFSAIRRLVSLNMTVDVITVCEAIDEDNELENIGGLKYLGGLTQILGSSSNIIRYVELVKEYSAARKLKIIGESIKELAGLKGEDLDRKISESMKLLSSLVVETSSDAPSTSKEVVIRAIEQITERIDSNGIPGVTTGLSQLDKATGGFMPGNLVVVAGRPSMGKTSFVVQSAEAAAKSGMKVLIFSLEMSEIELMERMLSSNSRLWMSKLKTGRFTDLEYGQLSRATSVISEMSLTIVDKAGLSVDKIRSISRKRQLKHGLDLIVIDQLSHIPTNGNNLAQEIGKNTSALKRMAKDLNVPVVLASQLNRDSAKAGSVRRPTLTDIRDSGSVEQDADVVIMIHRESYYDENANPTRAEIIIAKQRQGARGLTLNVGWDGAFTKFTEDPDHSWKPELKIKPILNYDY